MAKSDQAAGAGLREPLTSACEKLEFLLHALRAVPAETALPPHGLRAILANIHDEVGDALERVA